ncbi:hypothetical protein GCM10012287_02870 [Streptomyces daqingensis]|uniref:Uncharacterized protein n=1 Tax=Streptomyces daqingensis TaxID=1472640 RepID=A0ABQ2LRR7_9ACTN|nr:hypothetical protein [Streptomyces daqingensis]GGO42307.1 hypothetical protein GCM10012287_02870 [Streptomyces daqingensis]
MNELDHDAVSVFEGDFETKAAEALATLRRLGVSSATVDTAVREIRYQEREARITAGYMSLYDYGVPRDVVNVLMLGSSPAPDGIEHDRKTHYFDPETGWSEAR